MSVNSPIKKKNRLKKSKPKPSNWSDAGKVAAGMLISIMRERQNITRYRKDRAAALKLLHSFAVDGVFNKLKKRQVKQYNKLILRLQEA